MTHVDKPQSDASAIDMMNSVSHVTKVGANLILSNVSMATDHDKE